MPQINPNKSAFVLATVLGLYHLTWAALVAAGVAQRFIDFILWLHFIKPFIVVEAFSFERAAGLVLVTGAIGYVIGAVVAFLWNAAHRS